LDDYELRNCWQNSRAWKLHAQEKLKTKINTNRTKTFHRTDGSDAGSRHDATHIREVQFVRFRVIRVSFVGLNCRGAMLLAFARFHGIVLV